MATEIEPRAGQIPVTDTPFGQSPAQRIAALAAGLPGFEDRVALSGLTQPVAVRFAADGTVFVGEKAGLVGPARLATRQRRRDRPPVAAHERRGGPGGLTREATTANPAPEAHEAGRHHRPAGGDAPGRRPPRGQPDLQLDELRLGAGPHHRPL